MIVFWTKIYIYARLMANKKYNLSVYKKLKFRMGGAVKEV